MIKKTLGLEGGAQSMIGLVRIRALQVARTELKDEGFLHERLGPWRAREAAVLHTKAPAAAGGSGHLTGRSNNQPGEASCTACVLPGCRRRPSPPLLGKDTVGIVSKGKEIKGMMGM